MIAVNWSEFGKHGCVNCGCEYCYSGPLRVGGCSPMTCGECETSFVILADGLTESRIGFGDPAIYPKLQPHPRSENKHKFVKPDIKPEGEGEFFRPRGIGYDLAGFVECKESGLRIVKMFEVILRQKPKTWLDYREREPTWIQVKVQKEDVNLEKLYELTKPDGIITINKIMEAKNAK